LKPRKVRATRVPNGVLFFGFDIYFGMTNRKPSFLIRIANRPFCATHLRALLISLQRGDWRSLQMFLTEGAPLSGPAAAPVADVLRLLMADPTEKPTSTSTSLHGQLLPPFFLSAKQEAAAAATPANSR